MKIYELYSPESQATYFLKVSDTKQDTKTIEIIANVQELLEFAQYRITLIKTLDYSFTSVIIHGSLLSMENITSLCINYANNIEDITNNLTDNNV